MLVCKVFFNDAEYSLFKEGDRYIPEKKFNGVTTKELTFEEKKKLGEIVKQLVGSDDKIKLIDVSSDGTIYQHEYDRTNDWSVFSNQDGGPISEEATRKIK